MSATLSPALGALLDPGACVQAPSSHSALYFLGHATQVSCTRCGGGPVDYAGGGWGHVLLGGVCAESADAVEATQQIEAVSRHAATLVVSAAGNLLETALDAGVADVVVLGHSCSLELQAGVPGGDVGRWLRGRGAGIVLWEPSPGRAVLLHGTAELQVSAPRAGALRQDGALLAGGYVAGVLRGLGPGDRLRLAAACAWSTPQGDEVSPIRAGKAFRRLHVRDG